MVWEPDNIIVEDWGRLQVIINNRDLTFYRDVPTVVESWSSGEPFDDKQARLRFPGITSYESITSLPFKDFDNVEIYLVNKNNVRLKNLWEGFVGSLSDSLSETDNGLVVECVGALYQADFFLKPPNFGFAPEDAGLSIAAEMNLRSKYYGLRFKQMNWLTYTSVPTRNGGSWNQLLTGWAQELLANAYSPAFMFDGERVSSIQISDDGYWIAGDHGSYIVFGENMPNYGSTTWFNAIFIHLFKTNALYVNDVYYDRERKASIGVTMDGTVGDRQSNRSDVAENRAIWYGDMRGSIYAYTAIHGTDNLLGYRLLTVNGEVSCFGNATFHGDHFPEPLPTAYYQVGGSVPDQFIDMVRTPSGNGYWLLTWGGRVFAYGDATNYGNFPLFDTVYVAIETNPAGNGLYGLDAKGRVRTLGSATWYGDAPQADISATNFKDMAVNEAGTGYATVRSDGAVYTFGSQPNLGTAAYSLDPAAGGKVSQYTMMKFDGRKPIIKTKDTWSVDWTYTVGTPGVSHELSRDRTVMPNAFYGEGTDGNNCKWRNSKYPNFFPDSGNPPIWPGYYIAVFANQTSPGVLTWQRRMQANGYSIIPDGIYDEYDASVCRFMQANAGITVDGIIGPQTWATTFQPGSSGGDLKSAYIAPLVIDRRVEPFYYNANGSITGNNPYFDKNIMRIESFANYGEKSSKREATISAQNELRRNFDPGYTGTLTLKIDPEEGSRFEIKAGQNILYKGYRGQNVLLHVSGVEIDFEGQSVSVTVDSKARDLMTVSAMIERDRTIGDAPLKPTRPNNSKSKQTDDKVVFDCESKAGFIPWFIAPGQLWIVLRIPVGEVGTVVKTEFDTLFPATTYSIAIFDRKITANQLQFLGNPRDTEDYWKDFPEDLGLIIAWGEDGQMCGWYPGEDGDSGGDFPDFPTGRFVDASSWNFWSSSPPWVWVAIWSDENAAFRGRFYPGPDAGFNFASSDAIANPMEITPTTRPSVAFYG